jgi:hypothetical protein
MTMKKIEDTDQAWDERKLGAEAGFVGVAAVSHEEALQVALEFDAPKRMVSSTKKRSDNDV